MIAFFYDSVISIKDSSSISVVNAFLHSYVSHFSVPTIVTTDRGAQFESKLRTQLIQRLGAKRNRTTSYHPQRNGLVENFRTRLLFVFNKALLIGLYHCLLCHSTFEIRSRKI